MNLGEKIARVERQMKEKLAEIRATHQHKGVKGTGVEKSFRTFLTQYLPQHFSVGEGEIVDTTGAISAQTDVVITAEHHPFTFSTDGPGLFFIEGVCAAGEVKSVLTSGELETSLMNSRQ